jgi:hypothetical protein
MCFTFSRTGDESLHSEKSHDVHDDEFVATVALEYAVTVVRAVDWSEDCDDGVVSRFVGWK